MSNHHSRSATLTRLIYGSGDWGLSSFFTLRQIFYAIFLADVVGLEARLASIAALVGILWDAVNDPLVGMISDRLSTPLGRRRPFLLFGAIPFGLSFLLLWWAPPWQSQLALAITVTLAFMASDTLQTLIAVPFYSLTPQIAPDYDGRTTLAGYRMFFNLLASLATAIVAPMIVDGALRGGLTQQQGYLIVAALFGGLAIPPFLLIAMFVREPPAVEVSPRAHIPLRAILCTLWRNVPFRFATGLYMLNWISFDLVALMLPFFLVYWVAGGDLLASVDILGGKIALESVVLGSLLVTAVAALPLWMWASRRFSKRSAYIVGIGFWAVVQALLMLVQPGQIGFGLLLAVLAGLGVSTAHMLPDAIFPDVIEWDELRTRCRREGIYYGTKNFIRKIAGAAAIFLALQALGWFGYQPPPQGVTLFRQSATILRVIRILTGPGGAILLISAILVAWFYPLTRAHHSRICRLLERRRAKASRPLTPSQQ